MTDYGREEKVKEIKCQEALKFKWILHSLLVVRKVLDDVLADLRVRVNIKEWNAKMNVQNSPILENMKLLKHFCCKYN